MQNARVAGSWRFHQISEENLGGQAMCKVIIPVGNS
jgi:hypothetical protein